ncbi:MAG: hypothetical protein NTY02_01320, partial [Acidobacteria bacterium]|nr:hypothetical protein [Acidobacteriota bacterium]
MKLHGGGRRARETQLQPCGSGLVEHRRRHGVGEHRIVCEDPGVRRGRLPHDRQPALPEVLEKRRRFDDRIVFQRHRGHDHLVRCAVQEILERRARRRPYVCVGRPSEARERRDRVEDAALGAFRPFAGRQANHVQGVEGAESRRAGVDQLNAAGPAARGERLLLDPAVDGGYRVGTRARTVIESCVRRAQTFERAEYRGVGAQVALAPGLASGRSLPVGGEEPKDDVQVVRRRRRLGERQQRPSDNDGSLGRARHCTGVRQTIGPGSRAGGIPLSGESLQFGHATEVA